MSIKDGGRPGALAQECKKELTENILPFWIEHGLDREYGGITTSLDRRGAILETDKSVWFQGRAGWTFSTAYRTVSPKPEYLEAAKSCVEFIERHCFDVDGRMFFRVTREGLPVIKRKRYIFSEAFAAMAFAAYSRATKNPAYAEKARAIFDRIGQTLGTPGILEPKFNAETRPAQGFAIPMILLAVAQELRAAQPESDRFYTDYIDRAIAHISGTFLDEEHRCVLEQVGPNGERQFDHFEGRLLNPGHSIEASWFIMNESRLRGGDRRLVETGCKILDWMWEWGWDKEYGGIIYYRDALGKPGNEYWHDMKFWWPQTEAIIATLMAYAETKDPRYAKNFDAIYDWTTTRFPDKEFGEWYGYMHRDGRLSTDLKGNMYKGPFHIPRMYLECYDIAAGMK